MKEGLKILLLGAPGSGKGTQAHKLHEKYGFIHVSTGDIFRDHIARNTELGKKAQEYIDDGQLVPDEITISLVKERLSQNDCKQFGYILDGFPRTVAQAKALIEFESMDKIINLDLPLDYLMMRTTNRRTCSVCKTVYNSMKMHNSSCPECGGELVVRDDDNAETVLHRLEVYKKSSEPIIAFYEGYRKVYHINGTNTPENVFIDIIKCIEENN